MLYGETLLVVGYSKQGFEPATINNMVRQVRVADLNNAAVAALARRVRAAGPNNPARRAMLGNDNKFAVVGVAQLVEPRIVIPVVVGSSPIVHPIID